MTQLEKTAEFARPAESIDEELLALPAPPRGQRLVAMTLMAAVVAAAMGLVASVRGDLAYFFAAERPTDLGEATAIVPGELTPNSYVRTSGTPMLSGMVTYEQNVSGASYVVFPLAGQRQLFVQVPAGDMADPQRAARGEFTGRLVTFGQLGGRFDAVRGYLSRDMGMPVTAESFLLLADEPPGSYGWALAIAFLCLGIVLLNIWLMLRWFRPLKLEEDDDGAYI